MARATASSGYRIEVEHPSGSWVATAGSECGLSWGQGYLACHRETPGPTLPLRLVRASDGRVVDDSRGRPEVSLGMVAGWPTWRQYVAAARRALVKAADVNMRAEDDWGPTTAGRLRSIAIELGAFLATGS